MRNNLRSLLALLALVSIPTFATAHHSVAEFDMDKKITLAGAVKEVWFNNPHVHYFVVTKNKDGVEETWDVHGSSVTALARRGWTKNTIKVGDKITVVGSPSRNGANRVLIGTVTLANGTVLGGFRKDTSKEQAAQ